MITALLAGDESRKPDVPVRSCRGYATRESLSRSRELVRRSAWMVFGVVASIMLAYGLLTLPLFWRTDFLSNWLLTAVAGLDSNQQPSG